MTTIELDYSRYGHSNRVTVPLFKRERTGKVGEKVRVVGDNVPDRTATVVEHLDNGRKAVLELDTATP